MLRSDVIRPVSELLDGLAQTKRDTPALRDKQGTLSYRSLALAIARLAADLGVLGVRSGDRVAIYMANSTAWVEASLATIRAGGVSVGIPASATPEEAAFMLADSGARVLFTDAAHIDTTHRAIASDPALRGITIVHAAAGSDGSRGHAFEALADGAATASVDAGRDLDLPAWILYTSGTTGRPKGVLLSQRGMMWVVAAGWLPFFEWGPRDLILCSLPLTHSYPLDATLATLATGATMYLVDGFSPAETMDLLNREDVTVLLGVPTVFSYMLSEQEVSGKAYARHTLRMCVSAGAVLAPDIAERASAMLGAPILDAYGATEASTAITMTSIRGRSPQGSCGVSLPGMAVRVVDPNSGADRGPGEEGEVIARGPGIMLGYHERPDETASTLRDGWYHTGDLGRLDTNGYLSITGRLKDIIIRGGENIAPAEIEAIILEHPAVADCAVFGVRHKALGEVPVLAVVSTTTTSQDQLIQILDTYCCERLPRFKRPEQIILVQSVPRTGSGKVMRHRLRDAIGTTAS